MKLTTICVYGGSVLCGLAGYIGEIRTDQAPEILLRKMADAIAHRGPDEQGAVVFSGAGLFSEKVAAGVWFVHFADSFL